MIITRTPFRISFAGGGTDLASYYKTGYGAVVSTTIDKYMYITINKRFDDSIRVSYSKTEIVDNLDELQHDIVKAALRMVGISKGIEITSISDIPAGTGLGSSSSFTVGLLNALYMYIGKQCSAHELAQKACYLEIDMLKHPIGKQDQFAAAYGGTNYFRFNADGSVTYKPINLSLKDLEAMNSKLSMWYTGISRSADSILNQQNNDTLKKLDVLDFMRNQADDLAENLNKHGFTESLAKVLHEGWIKKKSITKSISNNNIDNLYEIALLNGAKGGKILGAGGGGFLLLYCDAEKHDNLSAALGLTKMPFKITCHGSRVVYFSET
ncbi:GHMP kinase [Clostridium sp. YIM B02515]|uniref:GHMP kinase n=1 Tax=Clostridium rhizosphaerae TaxID=2803861 RepID=A0ABS1T5Z5_9CLOT|nr:GHMP kinase [Clostridium rhizosphaerae]MBL4934676.1 GHMP kinase [Clostridium rhizosphaerae]